MDIIKSRLKSYFYSKETENHPFFLFTQSYFDDIDEYVLYFYNQIKDKNSILLIFADFTSIIYIVIRNLYDFPCLGNIKYRNKSPTPVNILGEDNSLLVSISILTECNKVFYEKLLKEFPEKIELAHQYTQDSIEYLKDIDIFDTSGKNLEKIKENLLIQYNKILDKFI